MVVEVVAGRVPVYVGTGTIGTKEVIALSQRMEEVAYQRFQLLHLIYYHFRKMNYMPTIN